MHNQRIYMLEMVNCDQNIQFFREVSCWALVSHGACWINFTGPIFHLQFADFPDPMLYSDYLPELSRHESCSGPAHPELGADQVSWEDLLDMDLPSFRPAFLVLCRVLLNVIHECLKLRLEQRPAGEPSLLSIKQASIAHETHFSIRIEWLLCTCCTLNDWMIFPPSQCNSSNCFSVLWCSWLFFRQTRQESLVWKVKVKLMFS